MLQCALNFCQIHILVIMTVNLKFQSSRWNFSQERHWWTSVHNYGNWGQRRWWVWATTILHSRQLCKDNKIKETWWHILFLIPETSITYRSSFLAVKKLFFTALSAFFVNHNAFMFYHVSDDAKTLQIILPKFNKICAWVKSDFREIEKIHIYTEKV